MSEITQRLSTALSDRYRIERHLGEGGMANVYLAEDLKHERKAKRRQLQCLRHLHEIQYGPVFYERPMHDLRIYPGTTLDRITKRLMVIGFTILMKVRPMAK